MATAEWNSIDRFEETFPVYNCAFLDILGYKERVAGYFDKKFNLFERISRALDTTVTCMTLTAPLFDLSGLMVEIVSDSIIITQPYNGRGLVALLPYAGWFSSNLSYEGLFIRGGIARGRHVRKQTRQGFDFLASEALQKAYILEHKRAIYPRVLIDKDLIASLPSEERPFILREQDEFILDFAHNVINREGNNASNVHAEVTELQHEMNKQAEEKIRAKYQWLLDYYHWTISQNQKWDCAAFDQFRSGTDRGFARVES